MNSNNNYQQLNSEPNQFSQGQNTPTIQAQPQQPQLISQLPDFSNYPPPSYDNFNNQMPQQKYSPPPPPPLQSYAPNQAQNYQALPSQNCYQPPLTTNYPSPAQNYYPPPPQNGPYHIPYQTNQLQPQQYTPMYQNQVMLQNGDNLNPYQFCPQCNQVRPTIKSGQAGTGAVICACLLCIFCGVFGLFACCCEQCQDKEYSCYVCRTVLKIEPYQPCG
ncbi:LITAF-like zinc ribbon domain protein (macronuclear) [Tetrahymena thermophila SB210]|uniref:LITAF-like zinc ribbon domain protein n=1 Tax=Tetrahymena thermophila (strain SB210) TaxID=312017 RepID=Q23RS3_TETTS|nr:LITAF-like zinc ribbon domain protein [Tetrahymena thermophila SB210]EAR99212.1 LITAF-like zinc ribbon domain protein [Tetrahymena thermophila SB210]|eukprot:XP_001019457.1 LITAF-like zinc ribbon domain protein [Tetrahymena thermophila SB210]